MLTRKATTNNTELKLRQALKELKESRDTCSQLIRERDDSEVEIKNIVGRNSLLKTELASLHTQHMEVVLQKDQLESTISSYEDQFSTYERALNRIADLEHELIDANKKISALLEQQQQHEVDKTQSLFEELMLSPGNGLYNVLLVSTCSLILLAIGMDLFGFSLVVTAACDLDLTVSQMGVLTSLPFIGILLVSYVWGYIADTRGRRLSLVVSMQVSFVLSTLCSICPTWHILGVVKFISICFSCAANSATYTLVGESCNMKVRSKYMLLMTCLLLLSPAAAGVVTYPILKLQFSSPLWFGITFTPWRLLIIALAFPSGLGAVAIYFCHESPIFLANCGRTDEALEVLKSIHAINNRGSKEEYEVKTLIVKEQLQKKFSLAKALFEQSAPLFRPPLLWRTLQLFYIVAVVYITNNSFLVWLAHVMSLVRLALETSSTGNICQLISTVTRNGTAANETATVAKHVCLGNIEENVVITLIASQSIFAFLNFALSHLSQRRKAVLMSTLGLSSLSGTLLNLTPEPISSVFFFMLFTCTCLCMGILASYFVDFYPPSYRGMVACLSIMVGRGSSFIGINIVGNLLFNHCQLTFYLWSLLVLSSLILAWFLPPDKPNLTITKM